MSPGLRTLATTLLWILVGGWIGAMVLFAAVVAPTAFSVLPSSELAGRVVSPTLRALHLYGGVAGLAVAALGLALGRSRSLAFLALGLSALSLLSHFGVTAPIAEVRDAALGADPDPDALRRFALLHRTSQILFASITLGALALAFLHARAQLAENPARTR